MHYTLDWPHSDLNVNRIIIPILARIIDVSIDVLPIRILRLV